MKISTTVLRKTAKISLVAFAEERNRISNLLCLIVTNRFEHLSAVIKFEEFIKVDKRLWYVCKRKALGSDEASVNLRVPMLR